MTSPTWPRHALLGMPNMLHSLCCALDTEFSLHRFQLPPVTPGVDRIRANPENDQFAIDGFLDILMTLHILCKRHSRKFVGSLLNRGWTGLPVLVLQMALDQQIHQRQLNFTHKTKLQAKTVDLSYHFISFSQPSLHGLHLVSVSATRSTLHPSSRGDFHPATRASLKTIVSVASASPPPTPAWRQSRRHPRRSNGRSPASWPEDRAFWSPKIQRTRWLRQNLEPGQQETFCWVDLLSSSWGSTWSPTRLA